MFKCLICNKEFETKNGLSHHITKTEHITTKYYYDIYLKHGNEGICPICGKDTTFQGIFKGYSKHCSISCAHLNKETQEKYKQTMFDRHGITNMFDNPEVQQKAQKSKFSEENLNKAKENCVDKYNTEYITQTEEFIENNKQKRLKKIKEFENQNNCLLMKSIDKMVGGNIWKKHLDIPRLQLGKDKFVEIKYLPQIIDYMKWFEENKYKGISAKEKEIVDIIKANYKDLVIENSRKIIYPYELDIYLPKLKLAIEFNGHYFHSISLKPKDYHYNKSKMCRNKNIRLIHIYEFENFEKQKDLLIKLLNGIDNYPKNDFNKNNLLDGWENIKPEIVCDNYEVVYGVGKLIT